MHMCGYKQLYTCTQNYFMKNKNVIPTSNNQDTQLHMKRKITQNMLIIWLGNKLIIIGSAKEAQSPSRYKMPSISGVLLIINNYNSERKAKVLHIMQSARTSHCAHGGAVRSLGKPKFLNGQKNGHNCLYLVLFSVRSHVDLHNGHVNFACRIVL